MGKNKNYTLIHNSRFYILISSVFISTGVFALLRLQIPSDQLLYIRAQQAYGLLAVLYLYLALIISPIGFIIGKQRVKHLEFARRAIGVSAFYFALQHGAISLWGQLGGIGQLQYLPALFKWSLLAGLVTFIVLLLMASTSLDKVIKFMTYRKWKWLHRLIYIATILVTLHIWSVGTHLAYTGVQLTAFFALVILAGLELFKTTRLINKNHLHLDKSQEVAVFMSVWLIVAIAIFAMPAYVQNYHSRHADHQTVNQNYEHNR